MPHWLVRPHGAVVEPRGRQRVKVPKRCAEMCHVPISFVAFIFIESGMQIYRFHFRMYVFFVTCWLKRNYAIRPLKDNANNSKIVAVTKCGYSVAEGCTSNGDDGLVLYICEMAYIYIYIYIYWLIYTHTHQSIFGRRRDTFGSKLMPKKKGCDLWWGTQLERPINNGAPFWEAQKTGVGNLWFKALFLGVVCHGSAALLCLWSKQGGSKVLDVTEGCCVSRIREPLLGVRGQSIPTQSVWNVGVFGVMG